MLGLDPASLRIITPDVGGAFGAKFGADPEHAVVCWVARHLGRPAALGRDPQREHGRDDARPGPAADVTIGGSRDGTVTAYRLEILQDCGAYPRFGAFLPALTILMAPGPYAIERAEAVARRWSPTPRRSARTAAPAGPRPPRPIERAIDLFAAEIGLDPAEVRRATCCPRSPSRTDRVRRDLRQR